MAQIDLQSDLAATYVGIETTFASVASTTRCFPVSGSVDISALDQAQVDVMDESVFLYDSKPHLHGLKTAPVKFDYYLRPPGNQLTSGASIETHPLGIILRGFFGNDATTDPNITPDTGNTGSTVQASSTTTLVKVAGGHGSRFKVGQYIAVENGSSSLDVTRVTAIATDDLTVAPELPATPTTSGVVINGYNYSPAQANSTTMSFQHAIVGDTSYQWRALGCIGESMELSLARGELAKASFSLRGVTWNGPSALSYSTAVATDAMGSPFVVRDAVTLFQAAATTTRTAYALESLTMKMNFGMMHIPQLGTNTAGNAEGTVGAFRNGARVFAEATLRFRSDTQWDAQWVAYTPMQCLVAVPQGSGVTKRYLVVSMPRCIIVGKPKTIKEGGRVITEVNLRSLLGSTTTSNLSRAPAMLALL